MREGKKQKRPPGYQKALVAAFEILSDTEKRKLYDETLGLSTARKSRLNLRPLGMFSQSLTEAQQNWTTWEQELLVVVKALEHFRAVVAGMQVYVHTDHLNNTSHSTALSYPDKIRRMLLKLASLVCPIWMFEPGGCQFGDGLSRNLEGRDRAREEAEGEPQSPKQTTQLALRALGKGVA